ncbi:MAG: hypothetical protein ACT4O9_01375 [Blastocatellia bacterium]
MSTDADNIARLKQLINSENESNANEAVGLALLIADEEDRCLYLQDLARSFVKKDDWQRAHGVTELMPGSYEKAETLRVIGEHLAKVGHLEKALSIFEEAEKAAEWDGIAKWQQAELLNNISISLLRMNARVRADEVRCLAVEAALKGQALPSEQNSLDASSVLAEIAENLASEERIDDALKIAGKVTNLGKREKLLMQISDYSSAVKRVA